MEFGMEPVSWFCSVKIAYHCQFFDIRRNFTEKSLLLLRSKCITVLRLQMEDSIELEISLSLSNQFIDFQHNLAGQCVPCEVKHIKVGESGETLQNFARNGFPVGHGTSNF
ncbi:hypothetical protein Adt_46072 [Abeliophyllum distichum]|uniref:Uncharacterized protein n=1 Tax=Abeliophyllum distichum TaxID=126358 RepID=A0ABD1P2N1_9LAMI